MKRIHQLDGLRGIAISAVLLFHLRRNTATTPYLFAFGWIGVDLFFVLSGFLITGILLDTKELPDRAITFYRRRFKRIFPIYYGSLFVLTILLPFFAPGFFVVPPPHDLPKYWAYLSNWYLGGQGLSHFWSLAIEEQFYLLWPLLAWHVGRKTLSRIAVTCIFIAPILRLVLRLYSVPPELIHRNTLCRIDTLLIGALCAIWMRCNPSFFPRIAKLQWLALPTIGILSLDHYDVNGPWIQTIGYSLIACSSAGVLVAAVTGKAFVLLFTPLRSVGRWSYGIYVYHFPIFYMVQSHIFNLAWVVILCLVLPVCIAALSYEWFEKKIIEKPSSSPPRKMHLSEPIPLAKFDDPTEEAHTAASKRGDKHHKSGTGALAHGVREGFA